MSYQLPADHVSPHIRKIADDIANGRRDVLSSEETSAMRINSYERQWLLAYIDDESLIRRIRNSQRNCRQLRNQVFGLADTYDEALMHPLMDELIERFLRDRDVAPVDRDDPYPGG